MELSLAWMSVVMALCVTSVASECNLPPSLWCANLETAQRCGVEKQCNDWERRDQLNRLETTLNIPRRTKALNLTLAYESYCPGCRHFITEQLWPVYTQLKDYLTVDLLPYGNAHEYYNAKTGKWVFDCQHGPKECKGNLIETCAIFIAKRDEKIYFPFIQCLEKGDPIEQAQSCANQSGISWDRISECVAGAEGNVYQHAIATETPQHNYVPWVIFNGIHNEKIENKALSDLKGLVCDSLPSPKPAPCLAETGGNSDKCWNDHN